MAHISKIMGKIIHVIPKTEGAASYIRLDRFVGKQKIYSRSSETLAGPARVKKSAVVDGLRELNPDGALKNYTSGTKRLQSVLDQMTVKVKKFFGGGISRGPKIIKNEGIFKRIDYDPKTGKRLKETIFAQDGKTVSRVDNYDPKTGKRLKSTWFGKDGKTIQFIGDYDPKTGKNLKSTQFAQDGKTVSRVDDYDPKTGKRLKETIFAQDGKTVRFVDDCDPKTGKRLKSTWFAKDGKTIQFIGDYDPKTGRRLKSTWFAKDGKTIKVIKLDPVSDWLMDFT